MAYPDGVTLDDDRMSKLKFAVLASAALIELFRRQRDAVGLSLFSEELDLQTPARSSRAHHRMLYDKLEGLLTDPAEARPTSAIDALHQIAEATPRRSLVLVFSDLLDKSEDPEALVSALQHLRHNKHEVVVFHLLDADTELDFGFDDRPTRFVDLETGEELKLHPTEVREAYVNRMTKLTEIVARPLRCPWHRLGRCRCCSGSSACADILPHEAGETFLTERRISFAEKAQTVLSLPPVQMWSGIGRASAWKRRSGSSVG